MAIKNLPITKPTMDISDEDLLSDDFLVVPNSVPDIKNFSSHLIIRLGIKSQSIIQTETIINTSYMHIYICIYMLHKCIIYVHTYIRTCMHTYIYVYAYMHTYVHTYMHACIHTCIHAYIRTCIHKFINLITEVHFSHFNYVCSYRV